MAEDLLAAYRRFFSVSAGLLIEISGLQILVRSEEFRHLDEDGWLTNHLNYQSSEIAKLRYLLSYKPASVAPVLAMPIHNYVALSVELATPATLPMVAGRVGCCDRNLEKLDSSITDLVFKMCSVSVDGIFAISKGGQGFLKVATDVRSALQRSSAAVSAVLLSSEAAVGSTDAWEIESKILDAAATQLKQLYQSAGADPRFLKAFQLYRSQVFQLAQSRPEMPGALKDKQPAPLYRAGFLSSKPLAQASQVFVGLLERHRRFTIFELSDMPNVKKFESDSAKTVAALANVMPPLKKKPTIDLLDTRFNEIVRMFDRGPGL